MTTKWQDQSEIVAGLIIVGRLDAHLLKPDHLMEPYNKIVTLYQKEAQETHTEVLRLLSHHNYTTAMNAAEAVLREPGTDITQYLPMIEELSAASHVGTDLESYAKALIRGDSVDLTRVKAALAPLETGARGFVSIGDIEAKEGIFKPAFFADPYLGGLIDGGLLIIGAPPGTGKTSILLTMAGRQAWQNKKVAIFSLEMPAPMLKYRLLQVAPWLETDIPDGGVVVVILEDGTTTTRNRMYIDNIIITDGLFDYLEVYAAVGQLTLQHEDLYAVYIDFADMMIPPTVEESAGVAGKIYRSMAMAAKGTNVPIVLLAQLSGGYVGGVPKVHHIRYTRLAEAMASSIWLLYNPNQLFADMGKNSGEAELPAHPGKAWIVLGKSRYGFPQGQLGAVECDFIKDGVGWGDSNPTWRNL